MSIQPGTRLGPFEVVEALGTGGMGEVYLATDTRLGRRVAIKVLPPHLSENPQFARRFEQEARSIASLNHPHICMLFDIGTALGLQYLVMEYLEGETLRSRLKNGPLTAHESVRIALQIAEGLSAAHAKGITHRDLKPENIFLTRDHGAKILDFGLAARHEKDSETPQASALHTQDKITSPGTVLGTIEYMAPEQACGLQTDARSDIYAFGLILYEMLTGHRCFSKATAAETLAAILRDVPDTELPNIQVSDGLRFLLRKCIQKNPQDRPQSAAELLSSLKPIVQSGTFIAAERHEEIASIAVLPFRNVGTDPENEYFSDGLTEELIADLSKISSLRVISRISAMRLKNLQKDLKEISKELNVRYLLEGSVRKAGANLRITAQLTDTTSDSVLWSDKYAGTLEDVFEIQERVSRSIVDSLRVQLTPKENRLLAERPFSNVQAYDAYLRARKGIWSFQKSQLDQAIVELNRAMTLSGENILLFRGMGVAQWQYLNIGASSDPKYLSEARDYAQRILKLDPAGPHGPALLGLIAAYEGNIREWIRQMQISIQADPNDTECISMLALGWLFTGKMEKAERMIARIEALDPLWYFVFWLKAYYSYLEGKFEAVLPPMHKSQELQPDNPAIFWFVAQTLASMGKKEEALRVIDQNYPDPEENAFATMAWMLKHALHSDAQKVDALKTPEFESAVWSDLQWTHAVAQCYALSGQNEEAMRWLTRATSRGFIHYPFLAERDPLLQKLRSDPAFQALMENVKRQWQSFQT